MTGKADPSNRKSMVSPISCSIVIRAFNEGKYLSRLLDGIQQQNHKDYEIILVDSGSTDNTLAIAARYQVKILRIQPENFSFGRSLNLGIAGAHGEFIVIASAHVFPVYPDWLERLLAPFMDPKIALCYGKQRGNSNTKFSEEQIFTRWYPEESNPIQTHPFCNNANAAIRRSLWLENPYNETLSGLEDLEWAHRVLGQGYKLAYVAEAEIIHVHDETPAGVYNRYRREAMAMKNIFPHESFNFGDFTRLLLTNIASDMWHAARKRVLWQSLWSIFWFRFMQFWGTYHGYRHFGPLTWQLRQTFYYPPGINSPEQTPTRDIEPIRYKDIAK